MNNLKKILFLLSLFAIFFTQFTVAQDITVQATIDSANIQIGQQAEIRIEVIQPADKTVNFPYFQEDEQLGANVEIVSVSKADTSKQAENNIRITQKYLITSFEPGKHVIPSFSFRTENNQYNTDSLSINVEGIEIAENAELKDIKPIYEPPFNWIKFLLISLCALIAVALVSAIVYIIIQKKKNKPIPFFDKRKHEPLPHETALSELDKVKEQKIWLKGLQKTYYTQLTNILRTYLSKRFGIPASEMTSSEIISVLKQHNDAKVMLDKLSVIFSMADMAKFAKYQFPEDENNMNLINAYFVVNQTILLPEMNPEEAKKEKTYKIPKVTVETSDPFNANKRLKEFILFGIEWGIFLRHNTKKVITPFLFIQHKDKRWVKIPVTNEDPVKYAKSILAEEKEPFDQFIIGYEGLLQNESGDEVDAVIVQGFDLTQNNGVAMGQMFNQKENGQFGKTGQLVFLGNPALMIPKKAGLMPDYQLRSLNIKTDSITEQDLLITFIVRISALDSTGVANGIKDFIFTKISSDSNNELNGKFEFNIPADDNKNEDFLQFLLNDTLTKEIDSPLMKQWSSKTGRKIDIICRTDTKIIYRYIR
jgi:hypothetical protein